MDLAAELQRLRLDLLTIEVSGCFTASDIPHVLLKGPSTSNWLYDLPRLYNDVDILVPYSQARRAAATLERAGIASSRAGEIGEEAPHSWLLSTTDGYEIDLHVSLPAVPVHGDRVWDALSGHIERFALDLGVVPAFDESVRCLVLSLHAVNSRHGPAFVQAREDLRRAVRMASADSWATAVELGLALGVDDLVTAGRALVAPEPGVRLSKRARLYLSDSPDAALGLHRLTEARLSSVPGLLVRELWPSSGFMLRAYPAITARRFGMLRARAWRWRRIGSELWSYLRSAYRQRRISDRTD